MYTALRRFTAILALVVLLVGVACGQAATPGSSPATSAKPSASASAPATSAEPSASASKPQANADWKAQWDTVVAAAKKEGRVTVAGAPGDLYRQAMGALEKAYPDIQLDYTGFRGVDFTPKVTAERNGGQYLWDVYLAGYITPFPMIAQGFFDPLPPALILPEVLDDSKWMGGVAGGLVDKGHQYQFQFQSRLEYVAMINRDLAPESELSMVDQLLDPKWKGKIAALDPRGAGPFAAFLGYLAGTGGRGEEWLRKFLAQDLAIMSDGRQLAEAVVRGRYPIGMSVPAADLAQFRQQGLGTNVKPLAPDKPEGRRITSGFGNVLLMNKAAHPNAAKVYINWLLSQEGQQAWVDATAKNSRRLDVAGPPETAPDPKTKYELNEVEGSPLQDLNQRAIAIAKEIIK